jgi:hypothetical protein
MFIGFVVVSGNFVCMNQRLKLLWLTIVRRLALVSRKSSKSQTEVAKDREKVKAGKNKKEECSR